MSASTGTFSYAQAAKGLAINSTPISKPASLPTAVAEQSPSVAPESQRNVNTTDKGAPSSTAVEAPAKDSELPETSKPGAARSEKAASPQINGESPPASPDFGMSSLSTLVKEDDQSSAHLATSSDATWDTKSSTSAPAEPTSDKTEAAPEPNKDKDSLRETDMGTEKTPQKSLHEAPPPIVNIWKQRAEARAATQPGKPMVQTPRNVSEAASEPAGQKSGGDTPNDRRRSAGTIVPEKKDGFKSSAREGASTASPNPRNRNEPGSGNRRREQRSADGRKGSGASRAGSREEKTVSSPPPPPPQQDQESWPTPEIAEKEDKKKAHEKPEKTDAREEEVTEKKKAHGKNAWVSVPFTPTVVFNTPLPGSARRGGRGGGRGGRENSSRGGSTAATNGSPASTDKCAAPHTSLQNGDSLHSNKSDLPTSSSSPVKHAASSDGGMSPTKTSGPALASTETASNVAREISPTKAQETSIGHDRRLSSDRGVGGYGSMRGQSSRGRVRRGDLSAVVTDRRRENDGAAAMTEEQFRVHSRRESVGIVPNENADHRAKGLPDDGFVRSKQQQLDRRGGPYSTYPNPRESRPRGGMRGGRGGSHSHQNSQSIASYHFVNGQPSVIPGYGYQASSPPGWQTEQQAPFHPPGQGHHSKTFRGTSRAQSIPTDAAYGRYNSVYGAGAPQMPPLQTFAGNMYDPQHPAQAMTAVPYSPYAEQYSLFSMVSMQLEYYFSVDNLCKDVYLRKNMDSQGFVFLQLVANFKRVKQLTTDLELIKYVCYSSPSIEWRVGNDGKDRLRRSEGWHQWVMPIEERDPSVQNEGPANITIPTAPVPQGFEQQMQSRHSVPNMPQSALPTTAPWSMANGTGAAYVMASPTDTQSGQQMPQAPAQALMLNGYDQSQSVATSQQSMAASTPLVEPEADSFSDAQAENLTVIVKKGDQPGTASDMPRTLPNGSLDGKDSDGPRNAGRQDSGASPDGNISFRGSSAHPGSEFPSPSDSSGIDPMRLCWIKDNDQPVDHVPSDTEREHYPDLHAKALREREEAPKGSLPHNVEVLYQLWSHFLIRNFNTSMYNEFRRLALDDYEHREVGSGYKNLLKYYKEALSNEQYVIRERVARHYVDVVRRELEAEGKDGAGSEKLAFKQLRGQWRDGATSMRNRRVLGKFVDDGLKTKLEAPSER